MSFSSKTKGELDALEIKNSCCRAAYRAGLNIGADDKENTEELMHKYAQLFKCEQCKQLFLRGVFITCGSVTNPERGYHLELSFSSAEVMSFIEDFLQTAGLVPKISKRKGAHILYYKGSSAIEDFFAYIGATKAVFILMNSKIVRELRNNANRVANCETNNIDKTITASQRHISAIRQLEEAGVLKTLHPDVREAARLRLLYQQMSLSELGAMFSPPISKSGVNHRLEKLMDALKNIDTYKSNP